MAEKTCPYCSAPVAADATAMLLLGQHLGPASA